jgi:hypothetical protein
VEAEAAAAGLDKQVAAWAGKGKKPGQAHKAELEKAGRPGGQG